MGYLYRESKIYFNEFTHKIVELGKSEIYRAAWQAGNSSKSSFCSLESETNMTSRLKTQAGF